MTNVQFDIQEYRDIELLNVYKERIEQGYPEEEVMRSIYVKEEIMQERLCSGAKNLMPVLPKGRPGSAVIPIIL